MFRNATRTAKPLTRVAARGMATEKQLVDRISSVGNIEKITKAMKMVSAAKLRGAQNALDISREFNKGVQGVWEPKPVEGERTGKQLFVAMTSDKGLCGAVNSTISRGVRNKMQKLPKSIAKEDIALITLGDKGKTGLERLFGNHFVGAYFELQKNGRINWNTACAIAQSISEQKYDQGTLAFNKFRTLLSYDTTYMPIQNFERASEDISSVEAYELEGEGDMLQNFHEFQAAVNLFCAFREQECSELSSRMNAMGNSSKNAGEMLDSLRLMYNRTRQARITTELIEIISGAVALEDA
jgi:F-type H+-transporting ATPase subunit gamma